MQGGQELRPAEGWLRRFARGPEELSKAVVPELDAALARLADGDREAFDRVFELALPVVLALARRWVGAREAEDVAQRTLLRVFERCHQYDPTRDARAWIVAVAIWEIRTERRRSWRRSRRIDDSAHTIEPVDPSPTAEEELLQEELRCRLGLLVGELSSIDQDSLHAFARGERKPGVVFRKRLQRALARLRTAWENRYES